MGDTKISSLILFTLYPFSIYPNPILPILHPIHPILHSPSILPNPRCNQFHSHFHSQEFYDPEKKIVHFITDGGGDGVSPLYPYIYVACLYVCIQ